MSRPVDRDILFGFLDEVRGYLPAVRDGLARLRAIPSDSDALEAVHRRVHTIKGAAAMIGLAALSHLAFHLEEVLERLQLGALPADLSAIDAVEYGVGQIDAYLDRVAADASPGEETFADTVGGLRRLLGYADDLPPPPAHIFFTEGSPPEPLAPPALPELAAPPLPPESAVPEPPAPELPAELLEVFRLEADEHLRVLTSLLPAAKANPADREQWQAVRRATHTLKGSAAMVGFADVTALAHRMEDLLDLYFDGRRTATADEIDLLLAAADAMDDVVSGRAGTAGFAALHARLTAALGTTATTEPEPAAEPEPTAEPEAAKPERVEADRGEAFVRVPIERLNEISKLVGELVISRTGCEQRVADFARLLNELDPSATRLRRTSARLEAGYEATALAGTRRGGDGLGGGEFDDLEMDRYTEFHLLTRELAETTADVQTLAGELGYVQGDFDGFLTRQARLTSELEDKLMRLRMVPLGTVGPKLHRTVRAAARQTGKRAELHIDGERTGLDKTMLDALADPLLHLLRNAVDHGIESAEVRQALGKPAHGTVTLAAGYDGGQVVLTVSDDGRGIDPEAVRAAAVARGVVPAEAAVGLTEPELLELLFAPGFSTRGEVSELSGRGVGLDVVKTRVEGLKGTVTLAARPGGGTRFTIRLPLTLAVTKALLVAAHGQTFAVPLDAVERIVRQDDAETERVGQRSVVRAGGEVYPLAHLGQLLRLRTPAEDVPRPPVLLLRTGDIRLALVVDRLLGGREVVVKTLGSHLKWVPGVSGATLTGDGRVVLILNPPELTTRATATAARPATPVSAPARSRPGLNVLIADDSPSVRRVLTQMAERHGWTATAVKDGFEAFELLQRGTVALDVVLTDVEMPRMDGFELLATVRAAPALRELPVVMITSRAADKHRQKAMGLGANAYVVKPYQEESLVEVVRRLTRK